MNLQSFSVSWFDLLAVILLIIGLRRGQKRGMSEELMDVLQWVVIVVACGTFYEPLGRLLSSNTVFSLLTCYIFTYSMLALIIKLAFHGIRRSIGNKLVEKDTFGRGEYYLGMAAGAFRYGCILLLSMALLHARYFTDTEIQARADYQQDVFGSEFFPGLADVQKDVFARSCTGRLTGTYLSMFLIRSTAPQNKGFDSRRAIQAREKGINEMLDRR